MIGMTAAILSSLNQFPQALKVMKTLETQSISLWMYCIVEVSIVLWLIYGILIHDIPLILADGLSLFPITYILYIKLLNTHTGKDKFGL